jgi:hypothetical protein
MGVRIGPGFEPPSVDDDGVQHRFSLKEEARLVYVAVTSQADARRHGPRMGGRLR